MTRVADYIIMSKYPRNPSKTMYKDISPLDLGFDKVIKLGKIFGHILSF